MAKPITGIDGGANKPRKDKTVENTTLFMALREFTSGLLNQLLVNLAGQDGQLWLGEFKKFLRRETCWVKVYLERLVMDASVGVTDGTESMPGLPASGHTTLAMKVASWKLVFYGTFAEFLRSLGKDRRYWSRSQVAIFCRDNPDKLRKGYGNFFELEDDSVADVRVGDDQPLVHIRPFSSDIVWGEDYQHHVFSLR